MSAYLKAAEMLNNKPNTEPRGNSDMLTYLKGVIDMKIKTDMEPRSYFQSAGKTRGKLTELFWREMLRENAFNPLTHGGYTIRTLPPPPLLFALYSKYL